MNRAQRRIHRAAFACGALVVPAVLATALGVRPPRVGVPANAWQGDLAAGDEPELELLEGTLRARLPRGWSEPDALVYASASQAPVGGSGLPPDARLVGSLGRARSFAWPAQAGPWAIVWSLGEERVLAARRVGEPR